MAGDPGAGSPRGGHPTRAVPELGLQPQRRSLSFPRLFPAGISLYIGITPLSPPCDPARPCPAGSATSGVPIPTGSPCSRLLRCGKRLPANPTIPSSVSEAAGLGAGLRGLAGARLGPGRVGGDVVPAKALSAGRQRRAGTSPAFPVKTSCCERAPAWEAAGRRGRAFSGILIPVCH